MAMKDRLMLEIDGSQVCVSGSADEVFLLKLTRNIKTAGYGVVMSATVKKTPRPKREPKGKVIMFPLGGSTRAGR